MNVILPQNVVDASPFASIPPYHFIHRARRFPIRLDTKQPALLNWQAPSTNDSATLNRWAAEFPGCAWAVAYAESGLILVESDPKARKSIKDKNSEQIGDARADVELAKLFVSWGLPADMTPHFRSRSGGKHFVFRAPLGVDLKEVLTPTLPGKRPNYRYKQRAIIKLEGFEQACVECKINGFGLIPPSSFEGRAYTLWPDGPTEPYEAPQGLLDHAQRIADQRREFKSSITRAEKTPDLKVLIKKVFRVVHDHGPMPYDVHRNLLWALIPLYGKEIAAEIGHRLHDGSAKYADMTDQIIHDGSETYRPGDARIESFYQYARSVGENAWVHPPITTMFGGAPVLPDIDAILAEIDAEAAAPRVVLPPPPPIAGDIIVPGANSLVTRDPSAGIPISEDDIALSFADVHGESIRYVDEWSKWLEWSDGVWSIDKTVSVFDRVRRHTRSYAAALPNQDARKLTNAKTVAAVEKLAKSDRRIAATSEIWDSNDWLLNTPGGVVDLRTGIMRPALPGDHMTKRTTVAPGGDCPQWHAFLTKSLGGDSDLIAFVQRMLGYALTGSTQEEALFFAHGNGGNGKGVLMKTVAKILGDYAKNATMTTFAQTKNEQHTTDLARLRGARLVTASETESGQQWAEAKIKTLTGGDTITARFMRADNFEFDPKFKLLIAGNHKPRLKNVDEAIRRRFYLIPFTIDIPKEERDEHLKENLQAEGAGILAWMVEGCLAWQREGLNAPASVVAATEEYLQGEDAILTWLSERCVRDANARVEADQLFGSWAVWAKVAGEPIGTKKEFYGAMRQHKFEDKRDNKGKRHFHGLDVIPIEAFKPDGARTAPEMFANVVPFSPRPAAPSGLAPTADGTLPPPPY